MEDGEPLVAVEITCGINQIILPKVSIIVHMHHKEALTRQV